MRITGGHFRGRILSSPEGLGTRPTSDRAREAVFNILRHGSWLPFPLPDQAAVLDVFAGTGALGLEALSQGADHAVFIENDRKAAQTCRENIALLKLQEKSRLLSCDALHPVPLPPALAPRNLVFLDPPYGKDMGAGALIQLARKSWLAENAVCVMEMDKKKPEPLPEGFEMADERSYGVALVRFLIYRPKT